MWLDARVPLRFGLLDSRAPDEAALTDGPAATAPAAVIPFAVSTHGPGCACCVPRSGAATALAQLFRERALSAGRPFRAVLAAVGPEAEDAIRAALADDPVVSARYRLAP